MSFRVQCVTVAAAALLATAVVACAPEAATSDAETEGVVVATTVDRSQATVGDLIRYVAAVEYPKRDSVEVTDPVVDGAIGGLEVVDRGVDRQQRRRRSREEHWWLLRARHVGSFVLPELEVSARAEGAEPVTVTGDEVFVEVVSVLDQDAVDIRDVKPLRRIGFQHWNLVLGAGALMLVALVWWLWRRRRGVVDDTVSEPSPAEVALAALERLRGRDLSEIAQVRRYYFAISQLLRAYVEAQFGLNATDLTTEEILERLESVRDLSGEGSASLRSFLNATDAVKYAAAVPSRLEIDDTHSLACRFVETTRPAAAPSEEADLHTGPVEQVGAS